MGGLGPQQGQGQQQAAQGQVPPELLMMLLSHLMSGAAQQGQPTPKDGTAQGNIGTLLPGLLQALQGQQQGSMPQQQQQTQPQAQQTQQPQQNPLQGIVQLLASMGIRLG